MKESLLIEMILLLLPTVFTISDPVVDTTSGQVRGQTVRTPTGKTVDRFIGIPFAEPPIGELRFKRPVPIAPWNETFNATTPPKTCFQRKIPLGHLFPAVKQWIPLTTFSEDCLKLNIWVPKNGQNETRKAVMVFIHGGGFSRSGISSSPYDGLLLASEQDIVVAMMNYRVASLGFLYLDHPDVPGNAGLYDQLLALHWIKDNIEVFGGDPERITLFGQSAGAASVGHHVLSPLSKGLFQRVIMTSGSPTSTWAYATKADALAVSVQQVLNVGCVDDNMTAMVDCLRKVDPEDFIAAELIKGADYVYTHKPVLDEVFLPGVPFNLFHNGNFNHVDLIVGVTKDEGSFFMTMYDPVTYPVYKQAVTLSKERYAASMEYNGWEPLTQQIVKLLYGQDPLLATLKDSWGDSFIVCPTTQLDTSFAAVGKKVFRYVLTHRSEKNPWPKWSGVVHCEELMYVFGAPLRGGPTYGEEDVKLSQRIMAYWGNFARTGDPNGNGTNAIYWPPYTLEKKHFLVLEPNSTKTGEGFREKYCAFWRDVRPQLLSKAGTESTDITNEVKDHSFQE